MKKYESINMNPKLIKNGGRKAIKMSTDEFKTIIKKVAKEENSIFLDEYNEDEIDELPEEFILMHIGENDESFEKEIYPAYMENIIDNEGLSGFHTLDNGFTFCGIYGAPDYAGASFYIMYYDGKKLRGYVPKYGNTVIVDCKGFENQFGEQWEAEEKHYKKWYKSPELFNLTNNEIKEINEQIKIYYDDSFSIFLDKLEKKDTSIPKFKFGKNITFEEFKKVPAPIAYRLANGYPLSQQIGYADDINWDAIETDIKSRIEV